MNESSVFLFSGRDEFETGLLSPAVSDEACKWLRKRSFSFLFQIVLLSLPTISIQSLARLSTLVLARTLGFYTS